ncbi:ABC transporter ATP-binding protein [Hutsoniella sourekii]|uniref:ABC transporter ATP-binding protein n=1 Tax=Hutsoniella sourekii TaxID=87650 RepID=UPI00048414B3|nr:ABC transporter ATP-binding protein [Hutsoniella sourekii]
MKDFTYIWRRLYAYIKLTPFQLMVGFLAMVANTLVSAAMPFVMGLAITELGRNLLGGQGFNYEYILKVLVLYYSLTIAHGVTQYSSYALMATVVQNAMAALRSDISEKVNRLPVSFFDRHQLGDILSRVTNDVDAVSNALQQGLVNITINGLMIIMSLAMMFLINATLTWIIIAALVISLIFSRIISRYSQPVFQNMANALGDLFGFTQEQLSGYTELVVYNQQDQSLKDFIDKNQRIFELGTRSGFLSMIMYPIMSTVFNGAYIVNIFVGGMMVIAGRLTIGNLQAFISYISQISGPLGQITQLIPMVQSAIASARRIFDFLDEKEEEQAQIKQSLPAEVEGQVVFDRIQFGYSQDRILMEEISFDASAGHTIAIVGPTGAGKTTLINLLMRFYDVDRGDIRIDGQSIYATSRDDLRSHMGMVLQDAWLFQGTVMENIRLGKLEANDYEVHQACKIANVDQFIKTLPGGYDFIIEENGSNISQGQRQLMTIARAVLADPDILILDEATSSVDTRLEQLIQDAMDKVMEGRTSFVIAHRLSTIRDADMILVMKDGTIIEQGSHDDLIQASGFYADLYNSQFNQEDSADIHLMGY